MTPEKRRLIAELLDDEQAARRQTTLATGGRILRRKRWRRVAFRSFAVVALAGLAVMSVRRTPPTDGKVVVSAPPAASQPRALTDEELLALFPDTPVALAKLENGKKRLIFPRPGDEQKFITRM